jgi:uncharacterized protein YkuJ
MSNIPLLGAFKKGTQEYIYPAIANKLDKYICPDCNKDLILKKGNIRIHHFSHFKEDNPCNYYNKPSESQIHKDAKMLIKSILDNKKDITIHRKCSGYCNNKAEEYKIPQISENSEIIIEYRFNYNGLKIADVAYIDKGNILYIFEICNTHKTEENNRPEPWFEIDAIKLINSINNDDTTIKIDCIRKKCNDCVLINCLRCNTMQPKWLLNLNPSDSRICKSCYICNGDYQKIYYNVTYSDKDKIKSYGGRFDPIYNKWYINNDNKNMNIVSSKWTTWKPARI